MGAGEVQEFMQTLLEAEVTALLGRRESESRAAEEVDSDRERMVSCYDFPEAHWKYLRAPNVVESPFAAVRLRRTAAKQLRKVTRATALIWRVLMGRAAEIPPTGQARTALRRGGRREVRRRSAHSEREAKGRRPMNRFTQLLTQPPRTRPLLSVRQ